MAFVRAAHSCCSSLCEQHPLAFKAERGSHSFSFGFHMCSSLFLFSFCSLFTCSSSQHPCPTMIKTPQSGGVNSKSLPSGSPSPLLTLVFSGFAEYMAAYTAHKAHSKAKPTSGLTTSSLCKPCKTVSVSLFFFCPLFHVRTDLLSGLYPEEGACSPFSKGICPVS